jgi:hypothetical protein
MAKNQPSKINKGEIKLSNTSPVSIWSETSKYSFTVDNY